MSETLAACGSEAEALTRDVYAPFLHMGVGGVVVGWPRPRDEGALAAPLAHTRNTCTNKRSHDGRGRERHLESALSQVSAGPHDGVRRVFFDWALVTNRRPRGPSCVCDGAERRVMSAFVRLLPFDSLLDLGPIACTWWFKA